MKNKKGFVIIELVIVIAIIAILAVALIPTFSGLFDKANETGDIALAREMNVALAAAPNVDNPNKAMELLQEAGYLVGNLNPRSAKNYYAWDSETNQILYISKDDPSTPIFAADPQYGTSDKWWIAVSGIDKMFDGFNNWIFTENVVAKNDTDLLTFDKPVGLSVVSGKTFAYPVSIATEDAGSIMLDGNFTEGVAITAPNADLQQYGNVSTLYINSIAKNSAHINGFIGVLRHYAGRLVVEPQGYIYNFYEHVPEADAGEVEIHGIVYYALQTTNATYTNNGAFQYVDEGVTVPAGITLGVTKDYSWKIGSVEELLNFRDAVNGGFSFYGVTVELTADLDLSAVEWNIPIGCSTTYEKDSNSFTFVDGNAFQGIFDGKGHTIKGLTIRSGPSDSNYGIGLFGYCSVATLKNFNLVDVDIDCELCASPVAAFLFYTSRVDNVHVSGVSKANWSAGIANFAQYGVTVENCSVDMDFTMTNYGKFNYIRVGGVIGQYNADFSGLQLKILNTDVSKCTMKLIGTEKAATVFAGGLVAQFNGGTITADYTSAEGTTVRHAMGAGTYGDIDPTLLGIPVTTDTGLTIGKQKLTAFPAG